MTAAKAAAVTSMDTNTSRPDWSVMAMPIGASTPDATPSDASKAVKKRAPVQSRYPRPPAVPGNDGAEDDHDCEDEQPRLKGERDADYAVSQEPPPGLDSQQDEWHPEPQHGTARAPQGDREADPAHAFESVLERRLDRCERDQAEGT